MTQMRQIYTDFYDVICHVELVETSHVTHVKSIACRDISRNTCEKYYMRPFDYAQGDRYICGYLVKICVICVPSKFPFIV